jgi:hypothetical protein
MSRAIRVVIGFILALAIPLHGIAAAMMAACGPGISHTRVERVGLDFVAENPTVHRHVHASPHARSDLDPHSQHLGHDKLAKAKCSVCASCCAGTAMPSTFVGLDSAALTESFVPAVPTGNPAFLTAGLERPPRIVLA